MPGPAPKPNARRRNARPDWKVLPAEGRSGPAPEWPLSSADDRYQAVWEDLWASPQAVAWEALGHNRVVARYVQVLIRCEDPETATAGLLGEVRQLEDRLGLSPMAMRRLQWEVGETPKDTSRPKRRSADDFADL
ncbi:phage terminase small subunit [Nocardia africana]